MACPYFMPVAKLENGNWPHPARLPLGSGMERSLHGSWPRRRNSGARCSGGILQSGIRQRLQLVAAGASRGMRCDSRSRRRPSLAEPGTRCRRGSARILLLRYVCERNHRPVEHGDLEFDLSRATWLRRHDDARIQKMAECFLESYLKKKSEIIHRRADETAALPKKERQS